MKKVMPFPKSGPDLSSLNVIHSQLNSYHKHINQNPRNSNANKDIRVAFQYVSQ